MCKVNPRNEFNNAKITNADIAKCPDLMIDNKLHDNLIMPSAKIGLDTIFQPNSNIDFGISADIKPMCSLYTFHKNHVQFLSVCTLNCVFV